MASRRDFVPPRPTNETRRTRGAATPLHHQRAGTTADDSPPRPTSGATMAPSPNCAKPSTALPVPATGRTSAIASEAELPMIAPLAGDGDEDRERQRPAAGTSSDRQPQERERAEGAGRATAVRTMVRGGHRSTRWLATQPRPMSPAAFHTEGDAVARSRAARRRSGRRTARPRCRPSSPRSSARTPRADLGARACPGRCRTPSRTVAPDARRTSAGCVSATPAGRRRRPGAHDGDTGRRWHR